MVKRINLKFNIIVVLFLLIVTCFYSQVDNVFADEINPRWATIVGHCDENYTIQDNNANYCASNSSVIYNYQHVFAQASDSENTEIVLFHQGNNDLNSTNSINDTLSGSVSIVITNNIPTSGIYFLNDDTMKLKNLDANIKINGNSTKVGTGKVLYRTVPIEADSMENASWNYVNLSQSVNLFFTSGYHVQIVVIYELKENYLFGIYHHIRTQFCFDIEA